MKETAILLQTDGGYWAKGKTFAQAIKNLREISTLRMTTKINLTLFFCNSEDSYESISCNGMNITYKQGDTYFQESEAFAFGDFFNMFAVTAETMTRLTDTGDKKLNDLVFKLDQSLEEYGHSLPEKEYDDICFYQ